MPLRSAAAILHRDLCRADTPGASASLDGVRGLAVLMVVWSHMAPASASWGGAAVWLFFLLSGLLLVPPLLRPASSPGALVALLAGFLVRRMLRLLPLYVLALPAYLWTLPADVDRLVWLVEHLAFVRAESVFWTQKTEVIFSVLLLPLAVLLRAVPTARGQGLLLLALALAYWYWVQIPSRWTIRIGPTSEVALMLTPFLLGGAVALLIRRLGRRTGAAVLVAGVALVALANAEVPALTDLRVRLLGEIATGPLGYWMAGTMTLLVAPILIAALAPAWGPTRLLAWAPLRSVGVLGYGVYLWHPPIKLALAIAWAGAFGWQLPTSAMFALVLALSLAAAAATYVAIERPGILAGRWLALRLARADAERESHTPAPAPRPVVGSSA